MAAESSFGAKERMALLNHPSTVTALRATTERVMTAVGTGLPYSATTALSATRWVGDGATPSVTTMHFGDAKPESRSLPPARYSFHSSFEGGTSPCTRMHRSPIIS